MDLEKRFQKLQCSQTWGFLHYDVKCHYEKFLNLERENKSVASIFPLFTFRIQANISFELYKLNEYFKALDYIDKLELIEFDSFMTKYKKCFIHLIKAMRCFCFFKLNLLDEVEEMLSEIENESETYQDIEVAGFLYLKSSFSISYGKPGSGICLMAMKEALALVPDESIFHNHLGMVLSRIRHYSFPYRSSTEEEIFYLRKAIFLSPENPSFKCDLGRAYMEMATKNNFEKEITRDYAATLFRDSLMTTELLTGNEIARCVYYISKIKFDRDLEQYAILARNKSSDSILVNHYVGLFFIRIKKFDYALQCLEKASTALPFVVGLCLLARYRLNNDYIDNEFIQTFIKNALANFTDSEDIGRCYLSFSEFYFLVMDDLKTAILFFNNYLNINCNLGKASHCSLIKMSSNYIGIMLKELSLYSGWDKDILAVKDYVSQLQMKQQVQCTYSLPSRQRLINSLF